MNKRSLHIIIFVCLLLATLSSTAQEILSPLSSFPIPVAAKSNDTLRLEIPFFDDFSDYEGLPDPNRWLSNQAFINKDYAPQPPSVGVATLDALDQNGELYPQASTNLFYADTLASQIIRLDSITGTYQRRLSPSDSVTLSFYFLPGGWYGNQWERVGDAPSSQDTLFLDFYNSVDSSWVTVWFTPGFDADTAGIASHWPWRYTTIKIEDSCFFSDKFQFRFRNYASLDPNPKSGIAGNCDQWNIDYIYLDRNRTLADSFFRDITFVEKAPSMLKHYQAMPARQFRAGDMKSELEMTISNRYNQTLASNYSYVVLNEAGQQIGNYDGGYENIVPFYPAGTYQNMPVHSRPPVNFCFPISDESADYSIIHVVREGVGGDNHGGNDTLRFTQTLGNYYAYDDGVPENGYGLTSTGNHMWFAYRFDLNTADTLTAVDLYFNRTRNCENEGIQFQICVWSCRKGVPDALLYKDSEKRTPQFKGFNEFYRYALSNQVRISDTVFIGFEQLSNDFINIGFDRGNDARPWSYYRTGNEWSHSILSGAVMMRPVFGASALLSTHQVSPDNDKIQFSVFPNPINDHLNISINRDFVGEQYQLQLYSISGKLLLTQTLSSSTLQLPANYANGVYVVRITNIATGDFSTKKIIINH